MGMLQSHGDWRILRSNSAELGIESEGKLCSVDGGYDLQIEWSSTDEDDLKSYHRPSYAKKSLQNNRLGQHISFIKFYAHFRPVVLVV